MIPKFLTTTLITLLTFFMMACSNPQAGPDKTLAGAVLGAGWGAGAGAVIANQLDSTTTSGQGAAIGAGFGFVGGALSGAGYDLNESSLLDQQETLASLEMRNSLNARALTRLQDRLDVVAGEPFAGGVYQVFFDEDQTSLRPGSIANLEIIAEQVVRSPQQFTVHIIGHTDDTGQPKYNDRLSEARARTVSGYIASRGVSMRQIKVESHGAKRPIASNTTPTGRQLNRRVDIYLSK